jgi:ADP-ribose pyrophosphatase
MSDDYRILEQNQEYSCPWFSVDKEKIQYPNKYINDFYIFKRYNAFSCIFAHDDKNVILLKQWRPTIKKWLWELPMGGIDNKEKSLDAAKREFFEETGFKANKWQELGQFYVAPGYSQEIGYAWEATNLEEISGKPQDNPKEMIEVHKIAIMEFEKMIKRGEICDGPSLTTYAIFTNKNK